MAMGLNKLRASKRTVIRVVAPLLAIVWLGAAAAPCATLTVESPAHEMSSPMHGSPPAEPAHEDHGRDTCERCSHCAQRPSLPSHDKLTAHSACATADAWISRVDRPETVERDLTPALGGATIKPFALPGTGPPIAARSFDPDLPRSALYVRFCTFLN